MNKALLITGGSKYLGLHAGHLGAQHGFKVILLDENTSASYPWALHIKGSYGNPKLLDQLFKDHAIDAVIHCAPFCTDFTHQSFEYYHHDLNNTITLLNAMQLYGIKKFIFASCARVYGMQNGKIHHDSCKDPITTSGKSKSIIEDILVDLAHNNILNLAILRLFCVAGALPEYNVHPSLNIITQLLRAAYTNQPFTLNVSSQTPDGTLIRDYIHTWDVAHAFLKAYYFLDHHKGSESFNIGSTKGTSIKQLIDIVQHIADKKITIHEEKVPIKEPSMIIADISKAIDLLGWQPAHSDIQFIVQSTYASMR